MAKKLNVYVAEECDRCYPHQDEDITVFHRRDAGFHPVKATLVISDERVFTESEVKEILEQVVQRLPKEYDERVDMVAVAHGIVLNPA